MKHSMMCVLLLSVAVLLAACGSSGSCSPDLSVDFGGCDDAVDGGDDGAPVPVAVADAATTDETIAVVVDVLDNDDVGTGPATVTAVTQGSNGTVVITDATTGDVTYTPTGDFSGVDTFSYTITDSKGNTSIATVTVTIVDLNPISTTLQNINVRATFKTVSAVMGSLPVDSALFARDSENSITFGPLADPSFDFSFFTGPQFDGGIEIDTTFSYSGGFEGTDGNLNFWEINLDAEEIAHGSLGSILIPSGYPHAPFDVDDPDTAEDETELAAELSFHFTRLGLVVPGPAGSGLDYASYGVWEIDGPNLFGSNFVGGVMSFGVVTSASSVPSTGAATYVGIMNGLYSPGGNDGTRSYLDGTATLTANFGAGTVTGDFTGITAADAFGESAGFAGIAGSDTHAAGAGAAEGIFTNVTSTATISGNGFIGSADTVATAGAINGAMSGEISGNFFGPAVQELGGVVRLGNPGGENAVFGFAAQD